LYINSRRRKKERKKEKEKMLTLARDWSLRSTISVRLGAVHNQKTCSFWLNFCTNSSFFLFFPPGEKRKKDELVQKFSQKEQT